MPTGIGMRRWFTGTHTIQTYITATGTVIRSRVPTVCGPAADVLGTLGKIRAGDHWLARNRFGVSKPSKVPAGCAAAEVGDAKSDHSQLALGRQYFLVGIYYRRSESSVQRCLLMARNRLPLQMRAVGRFLSLSRCREIIAIPRKPHQASIRRRLDGEV